MGQRRAKARVAAPLVWCVLFWVALGATGCQSTQTTEELEVGPEITESLRRFEKIYMLGVGDGLDVLVRGNDEVSRSVVIRPDGFISLPLLGDVRAAGLSVEQLDERLTERFADRLVDPEVTVIATDVREAMVYVVGEVQQPQQIPHRMTSTAAQAIALSGGFALTAHERAVSIIRLTDEGRLRAIVVPVEFEGKPAPYLALQAVALRPEDIIFVPPSGITQVNRFIEDHINRPLTGVSSILNPVTNYFLLRELIEEDE
jgi:polysaccharide export outer membrane protein